MKPDPTFAISESVLHQAAVLHLHGVFDGAAAPEFESRIATLLRIAAPRAVIDLSDVRYITSAGVGALVSAHRRVRAKGGVLVLAGPSAALSEVFTTLNLGSLMPIHLSLEQAALASAPG